MRAAYQTLGVGVDLAEVSATTRAVMGRGFLNHVFSPRERARLAPPSEPSTHWDFEALTGLFTLKESLLKALGTGLALGIRFDEIEGPPVAPAGEMQLSGRALEVAQSMGVARMRCGVSREGDVICGWVWIEGNPPANTPIQR